LKISTFGGVSMIAAMIASAPLFGQAPSETSFQLFPNPKFAACLGVSGAPAPTTTVTVLRGQLNDTLILRAQNLKPNLAFDLFTVQNSSLLSDGQPNPSFVNFGLAWYQSDVQADSNGNAEVLIKTILLDQIFGFDPVVGLAPTNTFHVGFWFNNPNDAAPCGFDVNNPTPFNGEHNAGPLAMISVPDAQTGIGPLCTQPESNGACHP
jgi:hypothetical protein